MSKDVQGWTRMFKNEQEVIQTMMSDGFEMNNFGKSTEPKNFFSKNFSSKMMENLAFYKELILWCLPFVIDMFNQNEIIVQKFHSILDQFIRL